MDNNIIRQGNIGIAVSGGADSALLLHFLLTNTTDTVHIYSFFSEKKLYIAESYTKQVVDKCIELTGNNNIKHHVEYIAEQTPKLIHSLMEEYIVRDHLTMMYTGLTKFPPDSVLETFYEDIRANDPYAYNQRKDGLVRDIYFGRNNTFCRPMINLNKKDVFELYKKFNLIDSLFPLTRSCENINSPDAHCGICLWCQERAWAFGKLL